VDRSAIVALLKTEEGAHRAFASARPHLERALARVAGDRDPAARENALVQLERVLAGPGRATYKGEFALEAWLAALAVRLVGISFRPDCSPPEVIAAAAESGLQLQHAMKCPACSAAMDAALEALGLRRTSSARLAFKALPPLVNTAAESHADSRELAPPAPPSLGDSREASRRGATRPDASSPDATRPDASSPEASPRRGASGRLGQRSSGRIRWPSSERPPHGERAHSSGRAPGLARLGSAPRGLRRPRSRGRRAVSSISEPLAPRASPPPARPRLRLQGERRRPRLRRRPRVSRALPRRLRPRRCPRRRPTSRAPRRLRRRPCLRATPRRRWLLLAPRPSPTPRSFLSPTLPRLHLHPSSARPTPRSSPRARSRSAGSRAGSRSCTKARRLPSSPAR